MNYKIFNPEFYEKKLQKFIKQHPDMLIRYTKTIKLLEQNPFHPSLRLHKLQGDKSEYYSVSINISYRIILDFIIIDKEITLIDIGSHDEVY